MPAASSGIQLHSTKDSDTQPQPREEDDGGPHCPRSQECTAAYCTLGFAIHPSHLLPRRELRRRKKSPWSHALGHHTGTSSVRAKVGVSHRAPQLSVLVELLSLRLCAIHSARQALAAHNLEVFGVVLLAGI